MANPGGLAALAGSGQATSRPNALQYLLTQSWPSRLLQAAFGGMTLPGDVYAGRVDPTSDEAIRRSADLAGLLSMGAGGMPSAASDLRMGIKVYHGSPYKFDKFDASKIGTGEGAQAYGRGLYFAESPGVAKNYVASRPATVNSRANAIAALRESQGYTGDISITPLSEYGDSWGIRRVTKQGFMRKPVDEGSLGIVSKDKSNGTYRFMSPRDEQVGSVPGKFYSADLDAHPDDFLHWDKPLSEQPPAIRDALRARFPDVDKSTMTGGQAYESLGREQATANMRKAPFRKHDAFDQAYASDFLQKSGVKGIRYLDQGSRKSAEGTYNYVVFDPALAKILGVE